jgi:hypothetical protein
MEEEVILMPFGDGTGPRGMGPMTGRGAGYCAGFGQPGFVNPIPGRGKFGFGFGWGRRYGYPYAGRYGVATPYMGYGYPYYGRGYTPSYGYPYRYP